MGLVKADFTVMFLVPSSVLIPQDIVIEGLEAFVFIVRTLHVVYRLGIVISAERGDFPEED